MRTERQTASIEKLYTKKRTASMLEVSIATVDRLRKCGALSSLQIGGQIRFKESEIERFIEDASSCQ